MHDDNRLSFQDFLTQTASQRANDEKERIRLKYGRLSKSDLLQAPNQHVRQIRMGTLNSILLQISRLSISHFEERQIPVDHRLQYCTYRLSSRLRVNERRQFCYWQIGQTRANDTLVLCEDGSFGAILLADRDLPVLDKLHDQRAWRIGPQLYDARCLVLRYLLQSPRFAENAATVVGRTAKTVRYDIQFVHDVCGDGSTYLWHKFLAT